ncbi:glycoside hydrolase family 13 protein [Ornithinimicrobium cryptoxanthini]|uniref:Glycoside hydrolase family 13 protein n=1 Tax=Ornithinimicrobium cryptoxanthini TaxID=2934161 RepID=A0ABY4YJJ9_9MICO|nr:glycoside hydrolase family 13 protein [Ornithinimicrobium cryptoxanthini]USQ76883.1 glycoside hydrolase family 13 protein [Ornithinimicrobium cryptoxanthini]
MLTPHHDGSPLYVSQAAPSAGDTVSVRVRIPHGSRVGAVHVRTAPDGEQEFVTATRTHRDDVESWWQAELVLHNPVTHYRFLLEGGPDGAQTYRWLNGTGLHPRDVPDAADFRIVTYPGPPTWATGAVVYQVFPDRFARDSSVEPVGDPGGPRTDLPDWATPARWDDPVEETMAGSQQVFGGTLDGIGEHLDHLVDLGVTVLYLTPFFPARSNHRYDAATFDAIDPILGDPESLARLQEAAHARGLKVMGDITTNHTGDAHEWFTAALADPSGPYADWYVRNPGAVPGATREWITWLGVDSLPKLDHTNPAVRDALVSGPTSVIQRWLQPGAGLDAWRVDVANMTGRYAGTDVNHEVARSVRDAVDAVAAEHGTEPLLVAEHVHDHSADATGAGWHGVMNYSGFTKPLWTWLRHEGFAPKFLGSPVRVPRLGGELVAETMQEFSAIVPWRSLSHSFTLTGSHDTTRVATLVGGEREQIVVAAGLLLTAPGIPMICYGDEIGMPGNFGEAGRRPMPWAAAPAAPGGEPVDPNLWDEELRTAYRDLVHARRNHPALAAGGMRWLHAEGDALIFLREHPEETALVHLARAAHPPITLPAADLPGASAGASAYGPVVRTDDEGDLALAADRPQVRIWTWRTTAPTWEMIA